MSAGPKVINQGRKFKILMVCLGNICRSPTAHGILEKLIQNKSLSELVEVDSAGISTYHISDHPDPR
ncbi:MAG: low molecular weight phosphotyrosine protein phosphatase, partial [Gammaproteobacteria bacterium]